MRIIGGQHAGFVIRPPKNLKARPTTDIAKESLFNILANKLDFEGLEVLDLFAGSGGISLEFASRGAATVTAVDVSPVTINFLKDTKRQLQLENVTPVKANAFKYLENAGQTWDIIFADPPYDLQNIDNLHKTVFANNLLKPGGLLVIEHASNVRLTAEHLTETRKYGQSSFSFYAAL
ncbi:MAG TPA: 16S rRNA (guanine(966)-N(2))-methyltransferase RsmD [Bacteroidia bacterium]|nr:16S rRNA (guanine(966)-N(2))-methyltransferase RsmD [Bacteroidia bacterium]